MKYAEEHRYVFDIFNHNLFSNIKDQNKIQMIYDTSSLCYEKIHGKTINGKMVEYSAKNKLKEGLGKKGLALVLIVDSKLPFNKISSNQRKQYASLHRNPNYIHTFKIIYFKPDNCARGKFKPKVFNFSDLSRSLQFLGLLDEEQKKTAIDFIKVHAYPPEKISLRDNSKTDLETTNDAQILENSQTILLTLHEKDHDAVNETICISGMFIDI